MNRIDLVNLKVGTKITKAEAWAIYNERCHNAQIRLDRAASRVGRDIWDEEIRQAGAELDTHLSTGKKV